jgi:hypothetical protein
MSSRKTIKQEVVEEGSHCQANPVAPVLGSVLIPLRRRQSRGSGDFSRDFELSRNSGEKSGDSGVH